MSIATEVQRIQTAKADIKTAIKTAGVVIDDSETIGAYASKVGEVYNKGYEKGKAEGGGLPKQFEWVYCATSPSINFDFIREEEVEFTLPVATSLSIPSLTTINDVLKHITFNFERPVTNLAGAFFSIIPTGSVGVTVLERITINADTSQCTDFSSFVRSMNSLFTTIDGTPFDFSSATKIGIFCNRCSRLAYLRVVPKTIKVSANFSGSTSWSDESLDSIFEGLADLTGSETQTLTMNTKLQATIEANQTWLAKITGRNWTLAFAA